MRLLFIFGTRPEAIKMSPLILKARNDSSLIIKVCVTGQHNEMLQQVLDFFEITPDYNFNIMTHNQSLFDITADILKRLEIVLIKENPHLVLVQGDTTTAFIGALAAFYMKIPVAHIEAGLRSNNKFSPFPEEVNRVLIGHIADLHFAPTVKAKKNLIMEGKPPENIHVVGNTVIDALFFTLDLIKNRQEEFRNYFNFLDFSKKIILVTGHRRESFGKPFREIFIALREISERKDVEIIYPVHLNPNVRMSVFEILINVENIHLIEPLEYPYLVWLMSKSFLVLTDSGGIQEEAPSLGKPVLVMRDVTEREEGIKSGTCRLVGTHKDTIVRETLRLLDDKDLYRKMATANNPYGDGNSSYRIIEIIKKKMTEIAI